MKVAGFQLRAKHATAFTAYMELMDFKDVAAVTGQDLPTVRRWARTDWWKELEAEHLDIAFRKSSLIVNEIVESKVLPFLAAAMDAEGLEPDEIKLLTAKSSVARMLMSIGGNPLVKAGSGNGGTTVNVNTQVNGDNTTLNLDKLKELTPEQKHRIALGGVLPEAVIDA